MWPFDALGLPADADHGAIKRAYARLLRSHRPDDDPVAFQQLHDAYQACLQQATWRMQEEADAASDAVRDAALGDAGTPSPAGEADAGPPASIAWHHASPATLPHGDPSPPVAPEADSEPAFDAEAFLAALRERLQTQSAAQVDAWLQRHDGLYSLDRKRMLRPAVVEAIGTLPPGTRRQGIDTVLAFFGLDSISRGDEWLHHQLDAVRRRQEDAERFEDAMRRHMSSHGSWTDRQLALELLRPMAWWRRLFVILVPGLVGRLRALLHELQQLDPESSARTLHAGSVRFWERATDRNGLAKERLALVATRIAAWTAGPLAYAAAINGDAMRLGAWPVVVATLGLAWLAYAGLVLVYLRWRRYNQTHLQWDVATVGLGLRTLLGVVLMWTTPVVGGIFFVIAGLWWVAARGDGSGNVSGSQWAAIVAGLAAFALAMVVAIPLAGSDAPTRWVFAAACVYALGLQAAHDAAWAHRRRIALEHAHRDRGWLWWVAGVHSTSVVGALFLLPR